MKRALIVFLISLATAGCGRKGPPVAPERRVPLPPAEVSATVGAGEVTLGWRNPTRRADNSRLSDLATARIHRLADTEPGEPRPAILSGDTVVGYAQVAVIRLDRPEPAVVEAGRGRFVDRADLRDGWRYTYVVTASDSLGRTSAPSRRVSVRFITASEPPGNLTGTPGEREVRLAWDPPARLADGRPLAGTITYQVLRASSPDAPPVPVSTAPITTTRYTDVGLENEQTYYYSVRAVRAEAGGVALSGPARALALAPRDATPPAPPTGLLAIASADAVRLTWDASPEPDVAGYVIYRDGGAGALARIGTARGPATVFVDRGITPGVHRYAVSAFDTASSPNESGRSAEVSVTVP